jgi:hypothetical protein
VASSGATRCATSDTAPTNGLNQLRESGDGGREGRRPGQELMDPEPKNQVHDTAHGAPLMHVSATL